jgi:ABC-type branched-subunit amino acid transport system ATPase component
VAGDAFDGHVAEWLRSGAMVTIAFGFVVEQGAAEWQDLTGGWNGLSGIPGPAVFGADIGEKGIGFLTVALTGLSIAAFSRLSDSPWVAVLGANGAGKTTLLRALSGLIRPMAGEVRFLGWRIDQLAGDRIAREGLILVPEGRQVFPDLSVIDNLRLGAYARGSAGEARRIEALLERFAALEARRHQRAGLLSGGEQQMLAIARGLMARPEVLMLDEPSLGLAPKLLEVLYDLLAELRGEGTTILLVDQMATLALSVADRAYVLQSGTIKHSGSAREVAGDPALMRAYLGDHGTAL